MSISIIMPAYNAGPFIAEAIASVLAQTHSAWELIIVDDGSSDNTRAEIAKFTDPRIRLLASPGQTGAAAARNLGTAAAQYELLSYFDADDVLLPTTLAQLFAKMQAHSEVGLVYADYRRMTEQGQVMPMRQRWLRTPRPSGQVLRAFLHRNYIVNGGVALVRKKLVDAAGGWNPSLRSSNDWALWVLIAAQAPFLFVPDLIALHYRDVATGITRRLNTQYERLQPAIEFVFAHPLVTGQLGAAELVKQRKIKDAHIYVFLAAQAARQRDWKNVFENLTRSVHIYPRHGLLALAEVTFAVVDGLRAKFR